MASAYVVILEEFEEELAAVGALVDASADPKGGRPRVRIAGANATILLLAATFEEFVREMAREFARDVVATSGSYDKLPPKLASVAWKRAMGALARVHLNPKKEVFSRESIFADALTRFTVAYEFCRGDLSQDIYRDLIHNDNNMRYREINSLFKVSGISDVCSRACEDEILMTHFGESSAGKTRTELEERLEDFFDRRNQVAHSIAAMRSSGSGEISKDIELLRNLGKALSATLENRSRSLCGTASSVPDEAQ